MDRVIVYDGALPQTIDVLLTNKFMMNGLSFALRAALGNGTVVHGLACSPGGGMTITINPGSIYALDNVDGTAYGDLGTDFNTILKQGIVYTAQNLTIVNTLPGGFSQVFLVQAQLTDTDSGNAVLPYYNAANPSQTFSGPNNSGTSQFTTRTCVCTISLVAGVAAPTGSQVTPNPSTSCVGLYAVTINNGTVTIVGGNIVQLPTAPFFPNLPAIPGDVQANIWTYAPDTSASPNVIVATIGPPPVTALAPGLIAIVKVANTNSGPTTLNLNSLGAVAVHRSGGAALSANDITAGAVCAFMYDGSAWQLLNYNGATSSSTTNNTFSSNIPYGVDTSGAANTITLTSMTQSGVQIAGAITAAGTISTGSATITMPNVSGFPWVTVGMTVYDLTNSQPIGTVLTWVATTLTLTANALHNGSGGTDSLNFSSIGSLVAGIALAVKVANTNTGVTTISLPGIPGSVAITENQVALVPNAIVASQVILIIYDGTQWQKITSRWPYQLFDESAPPASDIPMQIGDQTTVTFTNVTSIPLKCATSGGIFSIEVCVTANNATDTDLYLNPNNTVFGTVFKMWQQINSDSSSNAAPYINPTPVANANMTPGGGTAFFTSFVMSMFQGPNANDVTNNIGPFFMNMVVSTNTLAKMMRYNGGIAGGPVEGFEYWADTSTPWTSLGTIAAAKTGNPVGGFASAVLATLSGTVIVKRMA